MGTDKSKTENQPARRVPVEALVIGVLGVAYIVELEDGVWLAPWDGAPGRTIVKKNAKRFPKRSTAKKALKKANEFRAFEDAKFEVIEAEENNFMCEDCGDIIAEEEWEMFGGKCEECNVQL